MTKEEYEQLTRRPSRMEINNLETPYEAIYHFFNSFTLEDCRSNLWELYERCVMSYSAEGTDHDGASSMLFFYTHTEMLIEAAWLINNKRLQKKGGKINKDFK
jgi:hypothetical protein